MGTATKDNICACGCGLQMRKLERGERTGSTAAVAAMAMSACCRRKTLLKHFGECRGRCNAAQEELCDFCQSPKLVVRLTLPSAFEPITDLPADMLSRWPTYLQDRCFPARPSLQMFPDPLILTSHMDVQATAVAQLEESWQQEEAEAAGRECNGGIHQPDEQVSTTGGHPNVSAARLPNMLGQPAKKRSRLLTQPSWNTARALDQGPLKRITGNAVTAMVRTCSMYFTWMLY